MCPLTTRHTLLLVLLVFLTVPVLAQRTEVITGQVLLNERPPGALASSVQVELIPDDRPGEPTKTMVTAEGEYRFMNLPVGSFIITARAPGFRPAKTQVEIMGGNQTRGNTRLALVPETQTTSRSSGPLRVSQNDLRAPKSAIKQVEKAENALQVGKLDVAESAIHKAIAEYPRYAQAYFLRAQLLERRGNGKEAARNYEIVLEEDPTNESTYRALARLYRAEEEIVLLRNLLERWKKADSTTAEPYLFSAVAYYDRGDYSQAVEEVHLAERYPHDHLPHLKLVLVNCYNKLRDPEAAAAQMREFLERWPDDPMAPSVRVSLQEIQRFIRK